MTASPAYNRPVGAQLVLYGQHCFHGSRANYPLNHHIVIGDDDRVAHHHAVRHINHHLIARDGDHSGVCAT